MNAEVTHLGSITVERLRELFTYDPYTGDFTRRKVTHNRFKVGEKAGFLNATGRWELGIDGKWYLAHRLAWLYVYGVWPSELIDHIDSNPLNNSISNLREATPAQNKANSRVSKNNVLGVKGVRLQIKGKNGTPRYRARIRVNGKLIHLGYFDTSEKASQAYLNAAERHFGEFARSA